MPSLLLSLTNPGPPPCLRLRRFCPVELTASALGLEASPGGASGGCRSRSYFAGYARPRHCLQEARAMVDEGGARLRQGHNASLRILAGLRQWPLGRTEHGLISWSSLLKKKFTARIRDSELARREQEESSEVPWKRRAAACFVRGWGDEHTLHMPGYSPGKLKVLPFMDMEQKLGRYCDNNRRLNREAKAR